MDIETRRTPLIAGLLVVFLGVAACDDEDDDNGVTPPPPPPPEQVVETFTADLEGLNDQEVTGTATLETTQEEEGVVGEEDLISAEVDATGLAAEREILSYVTVTGACPDAAADTNEDGFVDFEEGRAVFGDLLIPLDDDLSGQDAGAFATTDVDGNLTVSAEADLATFMDDLQADDPDPADPVAKLGADEDLDLGSRAVVLLGIDAETELPEGVNADSVPVACGVLAEEAGA